MSTLFSYIEKSESAAQGLPRRCLRVAGVVAHVWNVFGFGLTLLAPHIPSPFQERLRIFSFGSILIALAMFSLILPFHYLLRTYEKEQDSA